MDYEEEYALPSFLRVSRHFQSDIARLLSSLSSLGQTKRAKAENYECTKCHKKYSVKYCLQRHLKWECGKAPQFKCNWCSYVTKLKFNLKQHTVRQHSDKILSMNESYYRRYLTGICLRCITSRGLFVYFAYSTVLQAVVDKSETEYRIKRGGPRNWQTN
ncbi:hypothetical protein RUM43_003107 [Polyplax serrata]|uniref:C2H2-type domain-containing protein n=1 Tax=Polyplax serrata TaxID=468196 RepID=A0AAN8P2X8_POLSC